MNARVRTSASDPMRIAELRVGRSGVVGLSFCPGKRFPAADGSQWQRSLEEDLEAVLRFGAKTVVSLIEPYEFRMLGVETLPQAVRSRGLAWFGLPMPDGGVPEFEWELRWSFVGRRIREKLRRGERVFVHCRGGLGRAGMVVARLLVEFGVEPESAIAQVRAVRPGAIETDAQAAWVQSRRKLRGKDDRRAARELAVLLGGAIGDALGYRVAFERLEAIRRRYGADGITLAKVSGPLVVSDQTQMTLFTLEGLTRAVAIHEPFTNDGLLDSLRTAYLDWDGTQCPGAPESRGALAREPLLRVRRAPRPMSDGEDASVRPRNDSKDCRGVTRVAPLGLLPAERVDDERLFMLAAGSIALTHEHPDSCWPAAVLALLVRSLVAEESWMQAIARVVVQLQHAHGAEGTMRALSAALSWVGSEAPIGALGAMVREESSAHGVQERQLAQGSRGIRGPEALSIGLAAAMRARSFEQAIELAANHDGDSDSTAALAGQLYAAAHGLEVVPEEAVERLDVLVPLLDVAEGWTDAISG